MKTLLRFILAGCLLAAMPLAARTFVHPGCSYTESDIIRMRAMIEAQREPYYTAFQALKSSKYSSLTTTVTNRGSELPSGSNYNGIIGADGRRAFDLALLYRLTDDKRYGDKAVAYLNANSYYTSCSSGTAALDLGKITLMVEAAELMRDYAGWNKQDQDRFKAMLVYPGYSTKREPSGNKTFYWNVYQGDKGRWGNQGLFGLRALMAMGIYLDNDTIYQRAYRNLMGLSHLNGDLAYPAGPPTQGSLIPNNGKHDNSSDEYMNVYQNTGKYGRQSDYGYDEQLQYYIFDNGQCQESARDQGHTMFGLFEYVHLAEMAWNQGDDLYGALNSRILKGLEWTFHYNLSAVQSYPDQPKPWSPPTFYQYTTRSKRWQFLKVYDKDRGDSYTDGGMREAALAHYAVRAHLDSSEFVWLQRYRDYMIEHFGYESHGKHGLDAQGKPSTDNWAYEFPGWGTLTKRREAFMTGDPVTFASGQAVYALPNATEGWNAVDFDTYHYGRAGEGHTYHNTTAFPSFYRQDATAEITLRDGQYTLDGLNAGEWYNYTVNVPAAGTYWLDITTKGTGSVRVHIESYPEAMTLPKGPVTLRLCIDEVKGDIAILGLKLTTEKPVPPSPTQMRSMKEQPTVKKKVVNGTVFIAQPTGEYTVNGQMINQK